MRERAKAKINLFLHVGARRADGYHALESLVVFADVADELSFEPAAAISLSIDGPFAGVLKNEPDNLVLRAAHELAAHTSTTAGARITLTKNLPVASGIGGGSADAAAALRGLAQLWNVHAPLQEIALSLGSDVPVCLASTPSWMGGRGEEVSPADLPLHIPLVLVNSGVAVSTAAVFERLDARTGIGEAEKPANIHSIPALVEYLEDTFNDLESPSCTLAPAISESLSALKGSGALLARMSGSGATCFGIFENDVLAESAAKEISFAHKEWWVKASSSRG